MVFVEQAATDPMNFEKPTIVGWGRGGEGRGGEGRGGEGRLISTSENVM